MRMPQAKSGYQRAECSKSQPFPPSCSAALRGYLSCRSLARDPGVLAPAPLPSPSVSARGDIPSTLTPRPGDPGPSWEAHPAFMSCHVSGGQDVPSKGWISGQQAPACISPGPEQYGVQRLMRPVAPHATHPCRGQHGGTHQPALLGHVFKPKYGCWDPGTGSGSAWAELDAVPGSSQAEQGEEQDWLPSCCRC